MPLICPRSGHPEEKQRPQRPAERPPLQLSTQPGQRPFYTNSGLPAPPPPIDHTLKVGCSPFFPFLTFLTMLAANDSHFILFQSPSAPTISPYLSDSAIPTRAQSAQSGIKAPLATSDNSGIPLLHPPLSSHPFTP